mmetsp:Transcript_7582/g.18850  ORF Transcript_7582/g.18850 Transcript_7582/m.18850 type:complete len:296 (+) Transcript_7582:88-975(+)
MLAVQKRLRRAWGLSRRGLSRGTQASGTPGPEEQKPSPQHREDSLEEGGALPPKGLGGTSGVPGSGPGVSGPGFPSMLERCQETAAPKDERSEGAAPEELNQSWETAPMDEISSSDSELSEGSSAGPDLPVRLSQISIASDMDSHDPWGQSPSDDDDEPSNTTTLTTPGFRQRADRARTFTASAPPGMRPPPSRRSEADDDATAGSVVGRDLGGDLGRDPHAELELKVEMEMEREMEMGREQPRRDCASEPTPRPPRSSASGRRSLLPDDTEVMQRSSGAVTRRPPSSSQASRGR